MSRKEVEAYYQQSMYAEIRPGLTYAFGIATGGGIAIDCGCGAGSNITHLRAEGYAVHAFDIDDRAISLCTERFAGDPEVLLSVDSFGRFNYPSADLIVADASLFFCPADEFQLFLEKVRLSLMPNGVFCGAFLGERDTMASGEFDVDKHWGEVLVLTEDEIRQCFNDYRIHQFVEHEVDGTSATGDPHHWHIFDVVAKLN